MRRLLSPTTGRTVIVPIDDSLINGPTQGLERMGPKIEQIVQYPPDAIMGFLGSFRNFPELLAKVPGILNLTASTIRSHHTRKMLVSTVSQALQLGVDGVAVHINISSKYESEMLHTLGSIAQECNDVGMPLLSIVYARSEGKNGDENYDNVKQTNKEEYTKLIAHAARVAVELGADIVKTQYTGDPDTFLFIVEACSPIPVVVAGGPIVEMNDMLKVAYEVVCAGGAGVSFGRNIFSRANPQPYIAALKMIVHEGATPEEAVERTKSVQNITTQRSTRSKL
jgi:DhnA family fructose-bisphosphate aldolase class Ia